MGTRRYRSWDERRRIVRAIVAESPTESVAQFDLSEAEYLFYRARSVRAIDATARRTAFFTAYYRLPINQPFLYILGLAAVVVIFAVAAALFILIERRSDKDLYPLLAASATVAVAAVGWCVAAWIAHRNAVRQNTTSLIFARFSQTAYTESLHRFHLAFGYDVAHKVTRNDLIRLQNGDSEQKKQAESVIYILNYFEFIASGTISGDLDANILRDNMRGIIVYYYDKCEPYIIEASRRAPKAFEKLIKLRAHYREP